MKNLRTPAFHGLRIYLTSTILYFFLVLPYMGFLVLQNLPEIQDKPNSSPQAENGQADTVSSAGEPATPYTVETKSDGSIAIELPLEEQIQREVDSALAAAEENPVFHTEKKKRSKNNKNLKKFLRLYSGYLILSLILGLQFNLPFKIYLRHKRKQKNISENLSLYCKKLLLFSPIINCFILFIPHAVSHGFALATFMPTENLGEDINQKVFQNFFYVSAVAAFLTLLFVYFWQRNRVHLKYIDFFFTKEELKKRIFRFKRGRIGRQFWLANIITTFLPLAIVVLYMVLSLTSNEDLQIEELTSGQKQILLGNWDESLAMINVNDNSDFSSFNRFYYVSAIDTIVMFVGIGTGILVSVIYIYLIVKWITRSVTNPVNELLGNMNKVQANGVADFTIVRTNDEVGELAEGFNTMIQKIRNYIDSISKMNVELEDKVIERTKEIAEQKEEIESQKEEIETQLEMVTRQKDTIEGQQHQIIDSIHYAKRIQTAILPPEDLLRKSLSDYFVLYNPRDIVSGDFYWHVEKDNKLYIAVADCTGHGVPGAFLSILGISYLNEIINKDISQSAADILGRLRESLIFSLHQKGTEGETQDGLELALCILDLENNTMQYSGANRPLYLVRKNTKEKSSTEPANVQLITHGKYSLLKYKPDTMPIGIYSDENKNFTNHDVSLLAGDSIYLFTDGYVDQLGGPSRKTFRVKYFRDLLFKIQEKEMSEQGQILKQKNIEWRGDIDQTDDILVFGMKI